MAGAGPVPAARARGLQAALLRKRAVDALAAGCEVLSSQARYGSTSHRNLQRAGTEFSHTKLIWKGSPT